jgi:hypothetical protein
VLAEGGYLPMTLDGVQILFKEPPEIGARCEGGCLQGV